MVHHGAHTHSTHVAVQLGTKSKMRPEDESRSRPSSRRGRPKAGSAGQGLFSKRVHPVCHRSFCPFQLALLLLRPCRGCSPIFHLSISRSPPLRWPHIIAVLTSSPCSYLSPPPPPLSFLYLLCRIDPSFLLLPTFSRPKHAARKMASAGALNMNTTSKQAEVDNGLKSPSSFSSPRRQQQAELPRGSESSIPEEVNAPAQMDNNSAGGGEEGEQEEEEDDDSEDDLDESDEEAHASPISSYSSGNTNAPKIRLGQGGSRAAPAMPGGPPPPTKDRRSTDAGSRASIGGSGPFSSPTAAGAMKRPPTSKTASSLRAPPMSRGLSEVSETTSSRSGPRAAIAKRSNLGDWAPRATPVYDDANAIDNLPAWNGMKTGEKTSRPINRVEKEMDWSMRRLLSENIFEQLLEDPLGRHRFRNFLASEGGEEMLDFYFDLSQYEQQTNNMKSTTEALHDLYLAQDADTQIELPSVYREDLYSQLRVAWEMQVTLSPVRENIRQSLYKDQFQRFVRSLLIEQNRVRLGAFNDEDQEYTGLGDCFCLTNPRAGSENPIVLASPGFVEVTGYPIRSIIGRNCRFLQGPSTAPDSVQRIRDALNAGKPITELLLNYRRDGTPFFCLLSIIPLRDASGQIAYYIGGQTNVTGTLASSKGLGFLVGNDLDVDGEPQSHMKNGYEISPTMARHFGQQDAVHTVQSSKMASSTSGSSFGNKRRGAAGAYNPTNASGPSGDRSLDSSAMGRQMSQSSKNGGGGSSSSGSGGFVNKLFGRSKPQSQIRVGGPQRLLGAEGAMRQAAPGRLADQMEAFADLYSRLIVFKRHKREVIFVTRSVLQAFGLPTESAGDTYNSELLHADFVSLMQGSHKGETKALRGAVQDAVKEGKQISLMTGLRPPKAGFVGRFRGDGGEQNIATYRAIHITPMYDRDHSPFAFVAVLGD